MRTYTTPEKLNKFNSNFADSCINVEQKRGPYFTAYKTFGKE